VRVRPYLPKLAIFRRKVYDAISQWKERYGGKYALLIEGARRVGKTTVVEQFVKKEYKSFIIVDFSNADAGIRNLFTHNAGDLDRLFLHLQQMYKTVLYERESAVVFDEVQLFPPARQMIKHLVADGRYDYIETGSLLSIKQNVHDILIPSEEMSIDVHPMDFEEFLWAQGDEVTIPLLKKAFEDRHRSASACINTLWARTASTCLWAACLNLWKHIWKIITSRL